MGVRARCGFERDRVLPQIAQQFEIEGATFVVLALCLQELSDSDEALPITSFKELFRAGRLGKDVVSVGVDA